MILCIEDTKDYTQKLLALRSEFIKVVRYKINIQKLVVFIYVSNEIPERESRKTISLKLHQKKIPRNQPEQGEKDLYAEKYKLLIKETEDDSKKWKNIPCFWIERILLKWTYYPKYLQI